MIQIIFKSKKAKDPNGSSPALQNALLNNSIFPTSSITITQPSTERDFFQRNTQHYLKCSLMQLLKICAKSFESEY
jgi:hypothetical protein